ncbi:hypothetical protein B0T19DRAFT_59810 [Cercophora scortea]|uniref:Uncharacterized protein n=1 Tax=Cercophora scortea TaxID=314031 RepID=A0AAE0J518_9PEZI|nr:hypothetical protein B0T19DRAFT_59810 [Cercophora scortea]
MAVLSLGNNSYGNNGTRPGHSSHWLGLLGTLDHGDDERPACRNSPSCVTQESSVQGAYLIVGMDPILGRGMIEMENLEVTVSSRGTLQGIPIPDPTFDRPAPVFNLLRKECYFLRYYCSCTLRLTCDARPPISKTRQLPVSNDHYLSPSLIQRSTRRRFASSTVHHYTWQFRFLFPSLHPTMRQRGTPTFSNRSIWGLVIGGHCQISRLRLRPVRLHLIGWPKNPTVFSFFSWQGLGLACAWFNPLWDGASSPYLFSSIQLPPPLRLVYPPFLQPSPSFAVPVRFCISGPEDLLLESCPLMCLWSADGRASGQVNR